MSSLFKILLALHIAGGFAGLISGTIAASVQKGSKLHNACGKIFFWSMLIASVAALVISNMPKHHNIFLFAVGGFTLYMICSGYRIVQLKRNSKANVQPFGMVDYSIALFGIIFSLFLLYMGVLTLINKSMFGIVPIAFGLICINFARMDYKIMRNKVGIKTFWMHHHITRMMGAMIASYTAFLVVNIQIQQNWILWLLPSLIGTFLIRYFIKKYVPVKSRTSTK